MINGKTYLDFICKLPLKPELLDALKIDKNDQSQIHNQDRWHHKGKNLLFPQRGISIQKGEPADQGQDR